MFAEERYQKFKDSDFDVILLKIKKGEIKCGKYANLVKIDNDSKVELKGELFSNGRKESKGTDKSGQ